MNDPRQMDLFGCFEESITAEEFDRWTRSLEKKGDYSTGEIAFLIRREHPEVNLSKLKKAFEEKTVLVWHHHDICDEHGFRRYFDEATNIWFKHYTEKHGYIPMTGYRNRWWFHPEYYTVISA